MPNTLWSSASFDAAELSAQITSLVDKYTANGTSDIKGLAMAALKIKPAQSFVVFGIIPLVVIVLGLLCCIPVYLGVECCSPGMRHTKKQKKLDKQAERIIQECRGPSAKSRKTDKLNLDPTQYVCQQYPTHKMRGVLEQRNADIQQRLAKGCGPKCCSRFGCGCYFLWWGFMILYVVSMILMCVGASQMKKAPTLSTLSKTQDKMSGILDSVASNIETVGKLLLKDNITFFSDFLNAAKSETDIDASYAALKTSMSQFKLTADLETAVKTLLGTGSGAIAKWLGSVLFPPTSGTPAHMSSWTTAATFFVDQIQGLETQLKKLGVVITDKTALSGKLRTLAPKIQESIANLTQTADNLDGIDTSSVPTSITGQLMPGDVVGDLIDAIFNSILKTSGAGYVTPTPAEFGGSLRESLKPVLISMLSMNSSVIDPIVDTLFPYYKNGSAFAPAGLTQVIKDLAGLDPTNISSLIGSKADAFLTPEMLTSFKKYRQYILLIKEFATKGIDGVIAKYAEINNVTNPITNILSNLNSSLPSLPFIKTDSVSNLASSAMTYPLLLMTIIPLIIIISASLCMLFQVKCCTGCSICGCGLCGLLTSVLCLALMALTLAPAVIRPQLESMKTNFTTIPNVALGLSPVADYTAKIEPISLPAVMDGVSFQPSSIALNLSSIDALFASIRFNVTVDVNTLIDSFVTPSNDSQSITDMLISFVKNLFKNPILIQIDMTGSDISKLFSDTPTALLSCIKITDGKSITAYMDEKVRKLTTETIKEERLFGRIDLDKLSQDFTIQKIKDTLNDLADFDVSSLTDQVKSAITGFSLEDIIGQIADMNTQLDSNKSLLTSGAKINTQEFAIIANSALETYLAFNMTSTDMTNLKEAITNYTNEVMPTSGFGLDTAKYIYANLYMDFLADNGNLKNHINPETNATAWLELADITQVFNDANVSFADVTAEQWLTSVMGEPDLNSVDFTLVENFKKFKNTADCTDFQNDLNEFKSTDTTMQDIPFTCEDITTELQISPNGLKWLEERNIAFDNIAKSPLTQLTMGSYSCRSSKPASIVVCNADPSQCATYKQCLTDMITSVEKQLMDLKKFLQPYFLTIFRRTLITTITSEIKDKLFQAGTTLAEQTRAILSIPVLFDQFQGLLDLMFNDETSVIKQILTSITGQQVKSDNTLEQSPAYDTSFVGGMDTNLDNLLDGMLKNILKTIKTPADTGYYTLEQIMEGAKATDTVNALIKAGYNMTRLVVSADDTLLGSQSFSLMPTALDDMLSLVMGPFSQSSVGYYLLFLYEFVGTICMACSISWMAARHYELKRAKKYNIKPRDLGMPMVAGRCWGCKRGDKSKKDKSGKNEKKPVKKGAKNVDIDEKPGVSVAEAIQRTDIMIAQEAPPVQSAAAELGQAPMFGVVKDGKRVPELDQRTGVDVNMDSEDAMAGQQQPPIAIQRNPSVPNFPAAAPSAVPMPVPVQSAFSMLQQQPYPNLAPSPSAAIAAAPSMFQQAPAPTGPMNAGIMPRVQPTQPVARNTQGTRQVPAQNSYGTKFTQIPQHGSVLNAQNGARNPQPGTMQAVRPTDMLQQGRQPANYNGLQSHSYYPQGQQGQMQYGQYPQAPNQGNQQLRAFGSVYQQQPGYGAQNPQYGNRSTFTQ